MELSRTKKAKLNICFSLLRQGVALICGLIVPRLLIGSFGSEAYGATASIISFLSYITLLDSGVGAVARSVLYKALAEKSAEKISRILAESRRFFRRIGYVFILYVLFLACTFSRISGKAVFDFGFTFFLVIVISFSTFAEYFIGYSYSLLLQADQMSFIQSAILAAGTALNTLAVVLLLRLGANLLLVKLASGVIFALRPMALALYARRHYPIQTCTADGEPMLKQKWTALGQHIAWTLHNNTDVAVLTVFSRLSLVSVYSVYQMVIKEIQDLTCAFTADMEAVFGNMLAKGEGEKLDRTFGYYETLLSLLGITLFSATAALIVPFVRVYTRGIQDENYIFPAFALILTLSSLLYCLREPYSAMVIAAGQFRETRFAAYGETLVNIGLSVILVSRLGLLGVAVGTLAATAFRFVYYVFYLSRRILHRPVGLFLKRLLLNSFSSALSILSAKAFLSKVEPKGYLAWISYAIPVTLFCGLISFLMNFAFYHRDLQEILQRGFHRFSAARAPKTK